MRPITGVGRLMALVGVPFVAPATGATTNLLLNPGFENVPNNGTGQGLLPSHWVGVNLSADTYSNDGSYGLLPWEFGNFPGVTAHAGQRWVAGANVDQSAGGESFGQVLSAPLQAGATYRVEGWLHQALRSDLNNPGGYDLWLDQGEFSTRLFLGHIGDTTSPSAGWSRRGADFVAPSDAAAYTRLVFAPIASGAWGTYPGLDDVSLVVVPTPGAAAVFGLGGLLAARRRR